MTCPDCKGEELVRDADGWTTCMCVPWKQFRSANQMAKSVAEIQDELSAAAKQITDLGYERPITYLEIPARGDRFKAFIHGTCPAPSGDYVGNHLYADTAEDLLVKISEYVAQMPDQNKAVVENFQKSVAELLERAKDLGLEHKPIAAAINPLTDLMKTLSDNAITDQSRVAAE